MVVGRFGEEIEAYMCDLLLEWGVIDQSLSSTQNSKLEARLKLNQALLLKFELDLR